MGSGGGYDEEATGERGEATRKAKGGATRETIGASDTEESAGVATV
jgi:hypothetical protein